jgi:hypothetical protein
MHSRSGGWRAGGACGGDSTCEWSGVVEDGAAATGEDGRLGWCTTGEDAVAVVCRGRVGGESSCRGKRLCQAAVGGHKNRRERGIK